MQNLCLLLCSCFVGPRRGARCEHLHNLSFLTRLGGCYEDHESYPRVSGRVYRPLLNLHEFRLWECYLENARSYFEFGLGGSTYRALSRHRKLEHVHSVELDSHWVASFSKQPQVAQWISSGRVILEHVDVGPVGSWSYPIWNFSRCRKARRRRRCIQNVSCHGRNINQHSFIQVHERNDSLCKRSQWPKASDALQRAAETFHWDVIFIDGRFRVAAFLKSLLTITQRMPAATESFDNSVILIHDYSKQRAYSVVEDFAEMEACAGSLAAFRPKENSKIDYKVLQHMIAEFQYDSM